MKTEQLSYGIYLNINLCSQQLLLRIVEVQVAALLRMMVQLLQDGEMVSLDAMRHLVGYFGKFHKHIEDQLQAYTVMLTTF